MFAAFDLHEEPQGELVIVNETDDGVAIFERIARGLGSTGTVAVGDGWPFKADGDAARRLEPATSWVR